MNLYRVGFFLFLALRCVFATSLSPDLPKKGVITQDYRGFIDPNIDYTNFTGRVTDKDKTGRILKVKVQNNNTKFFKNGDYLEFVLPNTEDQDGKCQGYVRTTEEFYFTMYVQDFSGCYGKNGTGLYFRRGTILKFHSETLARRVFEASKARERLLVQKADFLKQLNEINHFFYSYDQERIKVTAEFDKRINEVKELKSKALNRLVDKKKENLELQSELMQTLNKLDTELKHYRVERQELFFDRWDKDHDTGLPFGQRPMALKLK